MRRTCGDLVKRLLLLGLAGFALVSCSQSANSGNRLEPDPTITSAYPGNGSTRRVEIVNTPTAPILAPSSTPSPEKLEAEEEESSGEPESGIMGRAVKSPACPGPERLDSPCPAQPLRAIFHVYDDEGSRAATFQSDLDGLFEVLLEPGKYSIVLDETTDIYRAQQQVKEIVVERGKVSEYLLEYDTGMR